MSCTRTLMSFLLLSHRMSPHIYLKRPASGERVSLKELLLKKAEVSSLAPWPCEEATYTCMAIPMETLE